MTRITTRLIAAALGLVVAAGAAQLVQAGHGCRVPYCVQYCPREVTCYRPVCRTEWKEVTVTEYRCRYETQMVEKVISVPRRVVETQTRQYTRTVYKPVWETVERTCHYVEYVPVKETKKVVVDCGHWEVQKFCDPCGRIVCRKVWVPKPVEKEVTCVRYRPEKRTKVIKTQVCRMQPETQTITYKVPVCRVEYEQKKVTVPVTRRIVEPVQVTKKVPVTRVEWVPYKTTVMVPLRVPCCPDPCCR